jgi:hypothetical protein
VGSRRLTADYLGGFYSLDGVHPGATGHAVIANEILELLNRTYGRSFPPIDLQAVLPADPVAQYRRAEGIRFSPAELGLAEPAGGIIE